MLKYCEALACAQSLVLRLLLSQRMSTHHTGPSVHVLGSRLIDILIEVPIIPSTPQSHYVAMSNGISLWQKLTVPALWLLSGMLPGHVAGLYSYNDCHIDLGLLSNFARYSSAVA